ncbi:hypothetical protein [Vibrio parahaemolyticus]|uniref:hypothetical protein n=1 Tax=Vibrio parahaemolyticus TaxID=670 RepID=UPI001C8FB5BF|nr:hypothetical protein [Vibrio parahaemolyticus]MBY3750661.1 hypothetical protein [Vibrio parahaemolyticus]MBY3761853.1 hypothetical protein [Vibrio parahaemolyticus]MBY3763150.1 hypothetical protein [Vibrio parahaemolyticus]MBY3772784.1 hypothetical protein [Vibrio parahaemolyticus]MBY3780613.1 hypothetical protein [Vibrio parahaemolyticus]
MKFTLKASSIAVMAIVSASAFAAAPDSVTQTAGTEIHWSGKVPMEFSDNGVILTSQGGTPLTEALKGGDIHFLKGATGYDGTFESSSIPLELHYRNCTKSDGTVDGTGSVDCVTDGGSYVLGEGADAIGDLIVNSTWQLSSANFNIGGRENPELAATGQILMDGSAMTEGLSEVVANGKPVFTAANTTAATTLPSPGTRYTVNAAIVASNGI